MSSKVLSLDSPAVSVRTLVLELDADSASFITLRAKPDRRQLHRDRPPAFERRRPYTQKPASD